MTGIIVSLIVGGTIGAFTMALMCAAGQEKYITYHKGDVHND